MKEETPATSRSSELRWHPDSWSLRTKITAVLLLPVIVALVLAAERIQPELARAGALSAVRDQLPVAQSAVAQTERIDQEMVVAARQPGSPALARQVATVDAATGPLLHSADFAGLSTQATANLSAALGRLSSVRLSSSSGGVGSVVAGYQGIVFAVGETVPSVVAGANSADLTATAGTIRSLVQLRADVAVEEAMLRSAPANQLGTAALIGADQAVAEETLISGQLRRTGDSSITAALTAATGATAGRQSMLENALATGHAQAVPTLLATMDSEVTAINTMINGLVASVSNSVTAQTDQARSDALRDTALVLGTLLGALAVALFVARTLVSPVHRLHAAALDAAHYRLPETIARARAGEDISWDDAPPVPVRTGEEIGQLALAFDQMHRQALRLAGEQAELRTQVSEMFMTLSRRSQSLVELQLSVIEDLEADEQDPRRLDSLFRIDHIATRLRRNGENLQVLAGGRPSRRDHEPVSVVDLMRAGTSEVKDYRRVALGNAPGGSVRGDAAADVVHILAELLENATRYSPPAEKVLLTADRGADGGLLIEVVDIGLGMAADDLDGANRRLAAGDAVSPETTRRMGLYVVGRLAAIHGVTVRLRRTTARATGAGITASVHLPGDLVLPDGMPLDSSLFEQSLSAMAPVVPPQLSAAENTSPGGQVLALPSAGNHGGLPQRPIGAAGRGGANGNRTGQNGAPKSRPASRGTNGTSGPPTADRSLAAPPAEERPPVPALEPPKPPAPPAPTPIFDQMASSWFSAPEKLKADAPGAGTVAGAWQREKWVTPTDDTRRAAEQAVEAPAVAAFTTNGLPVRNPGAQLAPGAVLPRTAESTRAVPRDFRDPNAIRDNLSRHYNGMRAARQRTTEAAQRSASAGEGKAGS